VRAAVDLIMDGRNETRSCSYCGQEGHDVRICTHYLSGGIGYRPVNSLQPGNYAVFKLPRNVQPEVPFEVLPLSQSTGFFGDEELESSATPTTPTTPALKTSTGTNKQTKGPPKKQSGRKKPQQKKSKARAGATWKLRPVGAPLVGGEVVEQYGLIMPFIRWSFPQGKLWPGMTNTCACDTALFLMSFLVFNKLVKDPLELLGHEVAGNDIRKIFETVARGQMNEARCLVYDKIPKTISPVERVKYNFARENARAGRVVPHSVVNADALFAAGSEQAAYIKCLEATIIARSCPPAGSIYLNDFAPKKFVEPLTAALNALTAALNAEDPQQASGEVEEEHAEAAVLQGKVVVEARTLILRKRTVVVQGQQQQQKKKKQQSTSTAIDKQVQYGSQVEVERVRLQIEVEGYAVVTFCALDVSSILRACDTRTTSPAVPIFTCRVDNTKFRTDNQRSDPAEWTESEDRISISDNRRLQTRVDQSIFGITEFRPILQIVKGVCGEKHMLRDPVLIENKKHTTRQQLHSDYSQNENVKAPLYFLLLALTGETHLHVQDSKRRGGDRRVYFKKGELLLCKGDLVHAGGDTEGTRFHCKVAPESAKIRSDSTYYR
jgi:hypothetical protein